MCERTKKMALAVISFSRTLSSSEESRILKRQLLRSATSVAANYRAATRARSRAEFYAKLCIVVEEADETLFWLELLEESNIASNPNLAKEVEEVLKITSRARKNAQNASN